MNIRHVIFLVLILRYCVKSLVKYVSFIFRGLVPLHNACSYGHFEVTEMLLKVLFDSFNK